MKSLCKEEPPKAQPKPRPKPSQPQPQQEAQPQKSNFAEPEQAAQASDFEYPDIQPSKFEPKESKEAEEPKQVEVTKLEHRPQSWEERVEASISTINLNNFKKQYRAKKESNTGKALCEARYEFKEDLDLEVIFKKSKELLKKLVNEQDFTDKVDGFNHWDVKRLINYKFTLNLHKFLTAKFSRPKLANIAILADISPSCSEQADMFMAILAGIINPDIKIHVGYNGHAREKAFELPKRPLASYAKSLAWIHEQQDKCNQSKHINFDEFLKLTKPKTCIILGDDDGINEYKAIKKYRKINFYWFYNCGSKTTKPRHDLLPTSRFFPGIYEPKDFIQAIRKLKN